MTCFLTKDDKINEYDIDFISSVSSLISLSIDITMKNNNTHMLVHKLRGAISSINEAIQKLYFNNNINEFLDHLSKQACHITHSKETIIVTEKVENKNKMFSFYGVEGKKQTNIYPIIGKILNELLEIVLDDPAANTAENLAEKAKEIYEKEVRGEN